MKKIKTATFTDFLGLFPVISLPITLSDRQHLEFSRNNTPLTQSMIQQFILPFEEEVDEYTEFVPCFAIPNTEPVHALVYWKADLLRYVYYLITFDKNGQYIDRKPISKTEGSQGAITQSVVTIEEDWMISIVRGKKTDREAFVPSESRIFQMELLADGKIINI